MYNAPSCLSEFLEAFQVWGRLGLSWPAHGQAWPSLVAVSSLRFFVLGRKPWIPPSPLPSSTSVCCFQNQVILDSSVHFVCACVCVCVCVCVLMCHIMCVLCVCVCVF